LDDWTAPTFPRAEYRADVDGAKPPRAVPPPVDRDPDGGAADGSEFSDCCFDCGRVTPASKILGPSNINGHELARSYHSCEAGHESITHADWWTDWQDSEVIERIRIFDPSLGDGGTTWSGAPLPPY
jgi:hypothetical protein